jgi:imidazolonepropionase
MAPVFFGLTPDECLLGVTRHAARALGKSAELGTLEAGKLANFCLWDLADPRVLTYQLGGLAPEAVYIRGQRHA